MATETPAGTQERRLDLLYRLSRTFNSTLDLEEVLNHVMDEVIGVVRAERGFLMLAGPTGELEFKAARGIDRSTIEGPQFQISRGVVGRVAREGVALLASDASHDLRISDLQSVMNLGLRSILCVPILNKGQIYGVIYVDNRLLAGIFTQEDLELLAAIADNAAIAIENARLYQIAVEKGRLERELQMAHQVQESLLPRQTPEVEGWEFAVRWIPARVVAGDYYDFIPERDGSLNLVIADVTDKGMPASLFMVFTRSAIRASVGGDISLAEAIERANRLLCLESGQGLFVTLVLARLDLQTGNLSYVNAGHNQPLLLQPGEQTFEHLKSSGLPLGIEEDAVYGGSSLQTSPGDLIVLYTDGIPEATDPGGEQFGMSRLEATILEVAGAPLEAVADAILAAVELHAGEDRALDDITLLLVRRSNAG